MTFEQYWAMLIKRWQIILICFLVVGLGAYIGSKLMRPAYQSSSIVQVAIRSSASSLSSYNDLQTSEQLTQTEADLATGDSVLRQVASHYPGLSEGELAKEVSATTKLNTALFEIDVVDASPTRAAKLANDIAATLIQQQQQATQRDNASAQQQMQQSLNQASEQINTLAGQISALQQATLQQTAAQQAQGVNQGKIALLQVQLNGLEQRYNQEQSALAQLGLSQAQNGNPLQLVQTAQPSTVPVRPNIPLYTGVGLLMGLLLGVFLAFMFEQLDTRVRTPEGITQLLKWPVLTTIWRDRSSRPVDMINPSGQNINVESFRILRTNIGFSSLDKPLHSLVVTSPLPRDGKSTIAANLAIFMAKAGKSTLLIDADLHRPSQHILFNLSPERLGLSNAILTFHQFMINAKNQQLEGGPTTANLSLERFVHSVGMPNLWVMPSGPLPPNPSELFESKVMQHFLTVIANCGIEVVIFDTPPLLGLSDASILASKVDGALIVVDTTRITKAKLRQMKAALSQTGVHILGCVANKLRHKGQENTYYYYTKDQDSSEQSTGNGHTQFEPAASMLVESPYTHEQRMSSK